MKAEGTIITSGLTAEQLLAYIELAVEKGIERHEAAKNAGPMRRPDDLVPAKEAAEVMGFKTTKSLKQYHYNGLTPRRRPVNAGGGKTTAGRALFYQWSEVEKLKKLFGKK